MHHERVHILKLDRGWCLENALAVAGLALAGALTGCTGVAADLASALTGVAGTEALAGGALLVFSRGGHRLAVSGGLCALVGMAGYQSERGQNGHGHEYFLHSTMIY